MKKSAQSTQKLRAPRWPVGLVPWRQAVERFLERLAKTLGMQIEIIGASRSSGGDGDTMTFDLSGGAAAAGRGNLDVASNGSIIAGTIAGIMPQIDTVRLDAVPAPTLDITGTGTEYVVVTVDVTLSILGTVYVESWSAADGGITIDVTGTAPGAADLLSTTGTFKFLQATFVSGVRTYQRTVGDLTLSICDDGSGEGRARLTV